MTRKLDPHESTAIVRRALGDVRAEGDLHPDETLGKLLPAAGDRDRFQRIVHKLVKERKFKIEREAIPILPGTRLKDVTHAVSLSALPGNPTTEPDETPPPPPPPPKKRKGRFAKAESDSEESI
jgi:hypothetical protein